PPPPRPPQKRVRLLVAPSVTTSDDLPQHVDGTSLGGRATQSPDVHHPLSALPREPVRKTTRQSNVSDDLAQCVHGDSLTEGSAERPEVGHSRSALPHERVPKIARCGAM